MSQAIAYSHSNIQWTSGNWEEYSEDIQWTRISNVSPSPSPTPIVDDAFHLFNRLVGSVAVELSETAYQLSLTPLAFEENIYTSSVMAGNIDLDLEDDIWVEIPPLFTRRVNAKARNGGQGQPLADLGQLDED